MTYPVWMPKGSDLLYVHVQDKRETAISGGQCAINENVQPTELICGEEKSLIDDISLLFHSIGLGHSYGRA